MAPNDSGFGAALGLLLSFDPQLWQIVLLSLQVSLVALAIACLLGMPAGAALAIWRFPGRRVIVVLVNTLMGLPPVVVGLVVYLA
jgi:tungstate transport system permease protein